MDEQVKYISFSDGLVSVDRLQTMCDNDDIIYNSVISKPMGIVALEERTSNYSNTTGPGVDILFSGINYTPKTANRLVAIYLYVPYYASGSTGVLDSSNVQFLKDGVVVQSGFTDKKYYSGSPHGDHTSFFHGFLDIKPTLSLHTYNVQIVRNASSGYQLFTLSSSRPAQFWIEDLGDV